MDKTEGSQFELFFELLAERLYKENSLSDITWALCESNSDFKKLFLNFFFPDIHDVGGIILEREVPFNQYRPDFSFYYENQHYIIEVKIYDRDYHFKGYKEELPNSMFGWIANYFMSDQVGIVIKSWEGFRNYVELKMDEDKLDENSKHLIKTYITYLNKVCSIIKIKKMKLDNLESLFHFNVQVQKIIQKHDFNINTRAKNFTENQSGQCFEYDKDLSDAKILYPWFGIYFDQNYTNVCFHLNKPDYDYLFGERTKLTEGKYYTAPVMESDGCWFEMKKEYFNSFDGKTSEEQQEKILTDFFEEITFLIAKQVKSHVKA